MSIRRFIDTHYRHFNARTLVEAAEAYRRHVEDGGKMMVTLAGAMSTAELGLSLAEMIRRNLVHAITCTGANLEEDLFNLVAHDHYVRVPDWRNLSPQREKDLLERGLNRVTDTCIPEEEAFRVLEREILRVWREADEAGQSHLPHEYFYRLLRDESLSDSYQIDPADSWLAAAAQRDLPLFVPGWEDSTMGNILVGRTIDGRLSGTHIVRSGLEYMQELADWYCGVTMGRSVADLPEATDETDLVVAPRDARATIGFFQIGGGIAGDFPICVVPMIHQDLRRPCPYWGYFCQISDSTPSYGSYSGAIPSEKITWGKLGVETPKFVIESDATIVAPLVFAALLDW